MSEGDDIIKNLEEMDAILKKANEGAPQFEVSIDREPDKITVVVQLKDTDDFEFCFIHPRCRQDAIDRTVEELKKRLRERLKI